MIFQHYAEIQMPYNRPRLKKSGLNVTIFLFNFRNLKSVDALVKPMAQPLLMGKAQGDVEERQQSQTKMKGALRKEEVMKLCKAGKLKELAELLYIGIIMGSCLALQALLLGQLV